MGDNDFRLLAGLTPRAHWSLTEAKPGKVLVRVKGTNRQVWVKADSAQDSKYEPIAGAAAGGKVVSALATTPPTDDTAKMTWKKRPGSFEYDMPELGASLEKRGSGSVLKVNGKEYDLGKKATFGSAEKMLKKVLSKDVADLEKEISTTKKKMKFAADTSAMSAKDKAAEYLKQFKGNKERAMDQAGARGEADVVRELNPPAKAVDMAPRKYKKSGDITKHVMSVAKADPDPQELEKFATRAFDSFAMSSSHLVFDDELKSLSPASRAAVLKAAVASDSRKRANSVAMYVDNLGMSKADADRLVGDYGRAKK